MAVVYEAEHVALGKRAAVKVLHASRAGNAQSEARFAREARMVAALRHPHVAEVYDYGHADDGVPYLVIELADRGNLAALLEERGPLPLTQALELILPVAAGLAHAHEEGIVHRDVKPANILLAQDRGGGLVPKLCDFGIGKSASPSDARLTTDGALLGTLAYMPPEQLRDPAAAGPAADQYALAVIVYEAVTGSLPYEAPTTLAWMDAIRAGGAAPPSRLRPDLPAGFDDVVMRALAIDPKARFASVEAMAAELLRFASGRTWTTWARELGAREAATSTADDDARPLGTLDAPPPIRANRASRALAFACAALLAFGTGAAMAMRAGTPTLAPSSEVKAAHGMRALDEARDVVRDAEAGEAIASRASPAPVTVAHHVQVAQVKAAPTPPADTPPADAPPAREKNDDKNTHSFGSNRAPILE